MARGGGAGTAVTAAEFARLLRGLLPRPLPPKLAVAVSGGADSLALTLLAADWAAKHGVALTALTVDHRLRPESAREAKQVAGWLAERGIAHRILVWRHEKRPAANIQAAAREARYALLQDHCRRQGIGHLLLAHHRDDQAETFLLRSLRGSGVDGLAGMAATRRLDDGLLLLRPLLGISKARLVAMLQKRRQDWIEDPGNADPHYARVRVRQALHLLAGGDEAARAELAGHLAQTAANMARARDALAEAAYRVLRDATTVTPAGIAWLDPAPLRLAPDEVALRALARLLTAIGGQPLPPRLERLERLLAALRSQPMAPQNLHRCTLRPQRDGRLLVCREARHLPPPLALKPGAAFIWDGRFRIETGRRLPPGLQLAPLGRLRPAGAEDAALPREAWPSLPAVWRRARLLAVPGLAWGSLPPELAVVFRPAGTGGGAGSSLP